VDGGDSRESCFVFALLHRLEAGRLVAVIQEQQLEGSF